MVIKKFTEFPSLHVIQHPLILHKMALLRDHTTSKKSFKELVHEITLLLAYEATKDLPTTLAEVKTPLMTCQVPVLTGLKPVILPILRAGLGMVDAMLDLMPSARVGHIGLYRDEETHLPQEYYFKIPKGSGKRRFFVLDPMLATGGSAAHAVTLLKEKGVKDIAFICLLAAPEGIKRFSNLHPTVPVYCASLDEKLNEDDYILPGLGDAGDRLFGTK